MLVKRIGLLFLTLILSLAIWGCGGEVQVPPGSGLSQAEVDQIVASAITANDGISTAKFDMNMPLTLTVAGGTEPGTMTATVDASGAVDAADRELQMTMDIAADIPGQGAQTMNIEGYLTGGWLYVGIATTGEAKQWATMQLTDDLWQQENPVSQQMDVLKTALDVAYGGTETVNGVECYRFDVQADLGTMLKLLSQQQSTTGIDFSQILDLSSVFKETSVKMWVAKYGYLLMKAQVHMLLDITPADLGATADDFTGMTMEMDMTMNLSDYGQPVTVTVPPEALDAQEI